MNPTFEEFYVEPARRGPWDSVTEYSVLTSNFPNFLGFFQNKINKIMFRDFRLFGDRVDRKEEREKQRVRDYEVALWNFREVR